MPSDSFTYNVNCLEFDKIVGEYKDDMKDTAFDCDVKTYIFNRSTRWLTISDK